MATMDNREFVDRLIAGNGRLPEDQEDAPDNPPAIRIVEYTNQGGHRVYGVAFEGDFNPYRYETETQFVVGPRVIWTREESS